MVYVSQRKTSVAPERTSRDGLKRLPVPLIAQHVSPGHEAKIGANRQFVEQSLQSYSMPEQPRRLCVVGI